MKIIYILIYKQNIVKTYNKNFFLNSTYFSLPAYKIKIKYIPKKIKIK